jgi:hypothetical protein
MLLKQRTLEGIRDGSITVVFRKWKRPSVKVGGTLLTPIGQLAISALDVVSPGAITESEAAAAGFSDRRSLVEELSKQKEGDVYRIEVTLDGPDPRIELRESVPSQPELKEVLARLKEFDSVRSSGAWTARILSVIGEKPGRRAGDLADVLGMAKDDQKPLVRKLKGLGLTESLRVGYRLSPRGQAVLKEMNGLGS